MGRVAAANRAEGGLMLEIYIPLISDGKETARKLEPEAVVREV